MNTFQSTLSSPRNQRIIFWLALAVLAVGIVVLVIKLVGGSDKTSTAPDRGFKAELPTTQPQAATSPPLVNANGVSVRSYKELDPEIKTTIRRFVLGAVAGQNYADSWKVIAPKMKSGYTARTWTTSDSHPIVPFPVYQFDHSDFTLKRATKSQILVDIRIKPKPSAHMRQQPFRIELVPLGSGAQRWVVSYWAPLWTALVPVN
jgi:hypothetical protein